MTDRLPDDAILRAVSDTYFAYADAADAADVEAFAALFTEDATFDGGAPSGGRARIARHAAKVLGLFAATSHHVTNVRVRSHTATEAQATAAVIAWHQKADGSTFTAFGRYESTLRLDDGRWRFAEHSILLAGSEGSDGRDYLTLPRADLGSGASATKPG